MPYLKAILVNATDKSNRMLRAKSMECISLVGMAVGKEKFRDDAKQVRHIYMYETTNCISAFPFWNLYSRYVSCMLMVIGRTEDGSMF